MNTLLFSLVVFVVLYITVCALKYALGLVTTSSIVISGAALANHYAGQSAMLLILLISPVLTVVVTDLIGTLRSEKLPFAAMKSQRIEQQQSATEVVESAPLSGEWISGKTPRLTHQQPLIGDVKAIPKPWL